MIPVDTKEKRPAETGVREDYLQGPGGGSSSRRCCPMLSDACFEQSYASTDTLAARTVHEDDFDLPTQGGVGHGGGCAGIGQHLESRYSERVDDVL